MTSEKKGKRLRPCSKNVRAVLGHIKLQGGGIPEKIAEDLGMTVEMVVASLKTLAEMGEVKPDV